MPVCKASHWLADSAGPSLRSYCLQMKMEWTDALRQGAKSCLAARLSAGELAVLHLALTGVPGTGSKADLWEICRSA